MLSRLESGHQSAKKGLFLQSVSDFSLERAVYSPTRWSLTALRSSFSQTRVIGGGGRVGVCTKKRAEDDATHQVARRTQFSVNPAVWNPVLWCCVASPAWGILQGMGMIVTSWT